MLQLTIQPRRAALLLLLGVVVVAALLFLWWPAGTLVGLVGGGFVVHRIGTAMQRGADAEPWADLHDLTAWLGDDAAPETVAAPVALEQRAVLAVQRPAAEPRTVAAPAPASATVLRDEVREQLTGLKAELGDDYPDFARAARLVVETQYASAARLQRELQVPYSRARRLLTDLEQQHFVGPATGSLPRQVLMPKDRLPELEAVLAS